MSIKQTISKLLGRVDPTERIIKRMYYLAWKACPGPAGMGILQDRGTGVTEDEIFDNVRGNRDYPMSRNLPAGSYYGDYVFGRMMKMGLDIGKNGAIIMPTHELDPEFQAWCRVYPTYSDLHNAALLSLADDDHQDV